MYYKCVNIDKDAALVENWYLLNKSANLLLTKFKKCFCTPSIYYNKTQLHNSYIKYKV